jgi:NTP pyrophosphatase (non-canonical NTP hydrolase)
MNFKKTKIVNDYLKNGNSREYTLLKTAEELQELALILIQSVTKDTEIDDQDIIDEIGDVLIRINVLREFFPEDRIQERIEYKLKKFYKYITENIYRNI